MQYVYAVLWFAVGLMLIFILSKESKIFYFAGGFFLFLGGWWLADALVETDLFSGAWGIVFRCVAFAALLVLAVAFFRERRKSQAENGDKPDGQ